MQLIDLLRVLEPDQDVWIATGEDFNSDPDAELVADCEVGELRLVAVQGYWVKTAFVGWDDKLHIIVREEL